tara:strand:- start:635 stop:2017 length:1383 start_codon:yes stop_codon:yes gene_type:complete
MPIPYRGLSGTINDEESRTSKAVNFAKDVWEGTKEFKNPKNPLNWGHNVGAVGARAIESVVPTSPQELSQELVELKSAKAAYPALKIAKEIPIVKSGLTKIGDVKNQLLSNVAQNLQINPKLANALAYTRDDAIENLGKLGGQTSWGRTKRTIQGPVPPELTDKTFKKGAKTQEEAIMSGTTKFVKDGDPFQIRNYAAAYSPKGQTTKVATRKTTGRGITQEGNTRKINERLATADWITPEETKAFGKAMAQAAAEGMDGDHIVEVARVANAVRHMSKARRTAYFRIMENSGTHLGNHPKNIQKLSKELNQVVKPAEIRALDNALRKMDKRGKTLLEEIIFSGKKTKPTQFPDQIQRHIDRSQEIGIPEPTWKSGSIDYTWRPQSGTGQIDIPPQSLKTFKGLRDEFFNQIEDLPSGSVWELNPKFKDAKRRRIYGKLFEGDKRITRNADETLGWVLTIP